jgi:hypothetical protein
MDKDEWCVICEFSNYAGAEIMKSVLEASDVPAIIVPSDRITAFYTGVRVLVNESLVHRARWVLKNSDFSEAELNYLATHELPSAKEKKS